MKLFKLFILGLLIHGSPSCSMAQINGSNGKASIEYTTNFVKNPSAELNDLYVVRSNATATRDTTAANRIDGKASWLINATALGDHVQFELLPESSEVTTGGNCAMKALFKGDGTMYAAKVVDNGGALIFQIPLTNETSWREVIVPVTCGQAALARGVRIEQIVAGTSPAINVGKVTWARYNATYIQTPNTFSADISSTGVISNKDGPDHFNAATVPNDSTSLFAVTFKNISVAPKCWLEPKMLNADNASGRVASSALASGYPTSSEVRYTTFISNSSSPTSGRRAYDHTLFCKLQGADESKPALTVQDMDYGPRPYTPTVVGFGTTSAMSCTEARSGQYNIIDCKFTCGVSTPVSAQIPLPLGRTVLNGEPLRIAGIGGISGASAAGSTPVGPTYVSLSEGGLSYLGVGYRNASVGSFTRRNGDQVCATGETVSFNAMVPIQGWGPVTLPPVAGLVGVNDLNASVKKFFGVGSSDCSTIGNCPTLTNVGGATLGYLGSGLYTVTVPNGTCAQVLSCKFIANSSTTSLGMTQDSTAPTSTVYRANLRVTTSGVASTGRVDYECSCVAN